MTDQRLASYAGALLLWSEVWRCEPGRKPNPEAFLVTAEEAATVEAEGASVWWDLAQQLPKPLRPGIPRPVVGLAPNVTPNHRARKLGIEAGHKLILRGEDPKLLQRLAGLPGPDGRPPANLRARMGLLFLVHDRKLTLSEAVEAAEDSAKLEPWQNAIDAKIQALSEEPPN